MDNKKYSLLLASIGVPYSISGKIDKNILPEQALCLASPLFHEDAKACALVYTLLKYNFDLFDDVILSKEIPKNEDLLAIALLGGILHKANKNYFKKSISVILSFTKDLGPISVKKTMSLLADFGRIPYDATMQSLFNIKINEIEAVEPKKILPRATIIQRNTYFSQRVINSYNPLEQFKNDLCDQIIAIAARHELKQKEVAVLMGATPAQVNEVMKRRMDRFTVDFLIEKTSVLVRNLKVNNNFNESIMVPVRIDSDVET
ncbi:helix-turn-helix domain-containing protein [bacterium]|nr:helix-turn-helix domain-containing protein [bacterium]